MDSFIILHLTLVLADLCAIHADWACAGQASNPEEAQATQCCTQGSGGLICVLSPHRFDTAQQLSSMYSLNPPTQKTGGQRHEGVDTYRSAVQVVQII